MVHETLSYSLGEAVEFDVVCDKILDMVGDLAASHGTVKARRRGSFGVIPAQMATSLSMVITELCQNAIEHGLDSSSGCVEVLPDRDGDEADHPDPSTPGRGCRRGSSWAIRRRWACRSSRR